MLAVIDTQLMLSLYQLRIYSYILRLWRYLLHFDGLGLDGVGGCGQLMAEPEKAAEDFFKELSVQQRIEEGN